MFRSRLQMAARCVMFSSEWILVEVSVIHLVWEPVSEMEKLTDNDTDSVETRICESRGVSGSPCHGERY